MAKETIPAFAGAFEKALAFSAKARALAAIGLVDVDTPF
jgi:hypothetical protein